MRVFDIVETVKAVVMLLLMVANLLGSDAQSGATELVGQKNLEVLYHLKKLVKLLHQPQTFSILAWFVSKRTNTDNEKLSLISEYCQMEGNSMKKKSILAMSGCFVAASIAIYQFHNVQIDTLSTASINPLNKNSSDVLNNEKKWYVTAESLASYDRDVVLKLPASLKF